jgi:hypothetical protein
MNETGDTMKKGILLPMVMLAVVCLVHAHATEFVVNKQGADTNSGVGLAAAFLTIQKGVDALQTGDTLTIGPGEYHESVQREKLGGTDKETVIRAQIPGTVLLRGDVPAQAFRKVEGTRFAYVTDLACTGDVVVVNELDTLTILERIPSPVELDFMPGKFHHDRAGGKVFLSASDFKPAGAHRYSVSVIPAHGIYLTNPRRVRIEGLAVTGFNAIREIRGLTLGSIWGIFIENGKDCVIRECHAYLNGQGIGLNSTAETSGGNVIEKCAAWGNATQFGVGDRGGITLVEPRRDVVRDCTSFLNGEIGINIRGGLLSSQSEKAKSCLERNLAWGNRILDYKIKTGGSYVHYVDRSVGLDEWSLNGGGRSDHCLIGTWKENRTPDNIKLQDEKQLDLRTEFADPDNYDYRLQATSRFRGALTNGEDRGPFPFKPDIFYVRADGNDAADGLSVSNAWKTLGRGINGLKAGDTLYLAPGVYPDTVEVSLRGKEGAPISIRGRGRGPVVLQGVFQLRDSHQVNFGRLQFSGEVVVKRGGRIEFDNCIFAAPADVGIHATGVTGLTLFHCVFTGFRQAALALQASTNTHLSGNLYNNRDGVAVRVDAVSAVQYSDYNSYVPGSQVWEVVGRALPLEDLQEERGGASASPTHPRPSTLDPPVSCDRYSHLLTPAIAMTDGAVVLRNTETFAARGPFGRPIGLYRDEKRPASLRLVERPRVHSVSATTANLEWLTSLPATCELIWGDSAGSSRTNRFGVDCFGTFSLTGLTPGRTYWFKIQSLRIPDEIVDELGAAMVAIDAEPLTFTTLKENRAPSVYYVAPEGNDANNGLNRSGAWQTIQHAADIVNVGDTVLIAGGTYRERVRVRATGEAGAPITFRAMSGERVMMDGADKALNSFFVATAKNHLRFDGFYLGVSNRERIQGGFFLQLAGEFKLYQGRDVEITRCFADGRGGYAAPFIVAWQVEDLRVRNCVTLNKFSGTYFLRCPGLSIDNSVFARPMISSILVRNETNEAAIMNHNIFTDNLKKKADLNISFMLVDYMKDAFRQSNNCYLVRSFPPKERYILGGSTIGELGKYIQAPLFADPLFAGDPGSTNAAGFAPDRLMDPLLKVDFDSFFATHPEVVKRGIGLQPEAFKDFVFHRTKPEKR